jgi:hypothetical protein
MTPAIIAHLTRERMRRHGEQLAREQIQAFVEAATRPVTVTYHERGVEIVDPDGGTAYRLEVLCQGVIGIDGWTRAQVGEIEIAARRGR